MTTNPTIITKSGKDPEQVFSNLVEVLAENQKIIVQVVSLDYEGILAEADKIARIRGGKNVVVTGCRQGGNATRYLSGSSEHRR